MSAETFSHRRRSDLALLVRGVQAGMPSGSRHSDIETAVATAALRQGLSKGDAIQAYRRLAAEDRAKFIAGNERRIQMRLLGLAIAALERNASPDVAFAKADEACHQQGLSRTRMKRVFDKALADRQALVEAKLDRAARRRIRA